ncbi:MAG: FAD-binding oxidoreductase [Chloroflexota bacterium]|nr:FAD-binding oxidoreductase [Chloroflexota bacterium]
MERTVDGPVLRPTMLQYDEARRSFNALVDRRPAVIVQPRSAAGVSAAVQLAADAGLPVAVRGGGHSVAGHAMADGAVAIDLRLMRRVTVDPRGRTARVEGGALWLDVDPATVAHGLATPGGTVADTGVGGLALGGGIGHLVGTCGLTCDNLLAADVVTADGRHLHVDQRHEPDLLWALRGGGGNFGVVTAFEFQLHDVRTIVGGRLAFRREATDEVLRRALHVMTNAPPELILMPELSTRQNAVIVTVCYRGAVADADELLLPLRSGMAPTKDTVRACSYLEVQAMSDMTPFGLRHYWKGHFVRDIPESLVQATIDDFVKARMLGGILIEPIVGVARQEPSGGSAFGQRAATYNVSALASWEDPDEDADRIAWARNYASALEPLSVSGGGYLNYSTEETGERVRAAFGEEKFSRLVALKSKWDPDNRFRFNHNVARSPS